MKVVLKQDVRNLGKKGELVETSDGYARNFLFPRNLAAEADNKAMNELKNAESSKQFKIDTQIKQATASKNKLEGQVFKMTAKAGSNGRLFGSVTSKEIAQEIKKQYAISVDKRKVTLDTDIKELKKMTKIETYSDELKNDYGILVFPEAYACLKPLTSRGKIATGMSLMVDIGGGTTDISFFTIQDGKPEVYDFMSIDKGLNYLTNALSKVQDSSISDVTKVSKPLKFMSIGELWHHSKESAQKENVTSIIVKSASEIDISKRDVFIKELAKKVKGLITKLQNEFKAQTDFELSRLMEALQSRPLIYCGGGSTFQTLQVDYSCFKDKRMISYKEWDTKSVEDIKDIVDKKLVPILSTAYGLSISVADDNITKKPFRDIFENMRKDEVKFHYQSEKDHPYDSNYNTATSMYSDWDAYK